ncbi:glycosyltransferase [Qipengyuania atrilutea]|uniref:Glycosyltransferase n=1 Tax=Qipengyuania atrilutea TaxID=2744473 RepID=A0A850HCC0_9SPHN|nr:glycosyltransferase [Actirhodobacter atriluteus]NVD44749.1 glycosyltransferase [Actirhodobacter atriluteus]
MEQQGKVLCIVVPDLFRITQTFFHEHIARIHPGKTVVVHLSSTGQEALTDVPVCEISTEPLWPKTSLPLMGKVLDVANSIHTSRLSGKDEARIEAFFAKHGVTHLFAEFATSASLVLELAERLNLPLTSLSHGWDINIMGGGRVWRKRYERLFASSTRLAAVCEFLRQQMLLLGAPPEKVSIIPCAVEAANFEVAEQGSSVRVVMVCRLIDQKGPLQALRAFAIAHKERPQLTLDVAGNGPLEQHLLAEIDRLGLTEAVNFHGDMPHEETLSLIANSQIFIQHCMTLPGKGIESQAISLLEAMGHGLVPVVSRHGGMADHVKHGERGWLVEEGDEAAMAKHIVAMNDDADARRSIGAKARTYVLDNFSRERIYPVLRETIGLV